MTDRTCSIDDCDETVRARGWCNTHYACWRRTGSPLPLCLCGRHYMRWLTHGTTSLVAAWANAPEGQKWCPVCCSYKPTSDFNRNRTTRDGFQPECRDCGKRRGADWRKRNPGVIAAQAARRPRDKVNEAARRSRAKRRAEGRMPKSDRRARLRQVERELFTSKEIADRDSWLCQICIGRGRTKGEARIARSRRWPDGRSLSIDHIVPLARGGAHTRVNVQATHLECNLRKRVKGTDQLRLFG